jgi:dTDP-4-dehydrorhamnose reductase
MTEVHLGHALKIGSQSWPGGVPNAAPAPPIAIVGAAGMLGRAFAEACERRGLAYVALSRLDLDIMNPGSVRCAIARVKPWAIVNAAGYVRVDTAERDRAACRRANAVGPAVLAATCRQSGIRLLTFSSDLVFDGNQRVPYVESNSVSPLNIYGRTKVEAERRVLALLPDALVVRTSACFGPWDRQNFVTRALSALASGQGFRAPADEVVSPTYVPDLVDASLDLLIDEARGLWHLANKGEVSWAEFAARAAAAAGLDGRRIVPSSATDLGRLARRPAYSVLGSERGSGLPDLDDALARYVRDRHALGSAA